MFKNQKQPAHNFSGRRDPGPLEKVIEAKVCAYAKANGIWHSKFTSPTRASVPDQYFEMPGAHFFIEFKRLGELPTPAQFACHRDIQAHGGVVHVVDNVTDGMMLINKYLLLK